MASIDDIASQIISLHIQKQILDNDMFQVQDEGEFNLLLPVSLAVKKPEGVIPTLPNVLELFTKLKED